MSQDIKRFHSNNKIVCVCSITGSQDVAADKDIVDKYGITHILNLGTYGKNHIPDTITYRNFMCDHNVDVKVLPKFPVSFKFLDEGRAKGCVFTHCNAGVSRAATLICILTYLSHLFISFLIHFLFVLLFFLCLEYLIGSFLIFPFMTLH